MTLTRPERRKRPKWATFRQSTRVKKFSRFQVSLYCECVTHYRQDFSPDDPYILPKRPVACGPFTPNGP